MITLHGFGSRLGLPDASPFVLKIDAYLRLAGLDYERVSGLGNMRKAPKGKLPFIIDDEELVCDSTFVIEHLQSKYNISLDDHLSDSQRAIAFFLRSTLEEKLYWCTLYFRWVHNDGWQVVKPALFGDMAAPLKWFVPALVRRGTRTATYKQGTGRHNPEDILHIAREVLASVDTLLDDGPFLFGEKPCSTDAALYAFLAQLTLANIDSPVNRIASEYPKLLAYSEHFRDSYYGAPDQ